MKVCVQGQSLNATLSQIRVSSINLHLFFSKMFSKGSKVFVNIHIPCRILKVDMVGQVCIK